MNVTYGHSISSLYKWLQVFSDTQMEADKCDKNYLSEVILTSFWLQETKDPKLARGVMCGTVDTKSSKSHPVTSRAAHAQSTERRANEVMGWHIP